VKVVKNKQMKAVKSIAMVRIQMRNFWAKVSDKFIKAPADISGPSILPQDQGESLFFQLILISSFIYIIDFHMASPPATANKSGQHIQGKQQLYILYWFITDLQMLAWKVPCRVDLREVIKV
jgi:hypothetical protein